VRHPVRRKSGKETGRRTARPLLHLPEADWPEADRAAFASAFDRPHDVFDAEGSGSLLKPRTKAALCFAYRRWLGWMSADHSDLLEEPPERRATPERVKAFVVHLRQTCSPRTVASQVGKLYDALRCMFLARDWTWLNQLKTRLERATPKKGRRPIVITSQRLVDAGLERLDAVELAFAIAGPNASRKHLQALALAYRDGSLVSIAALVPMRRINISQLEIGSTICRGPKHWAIHVSGDQVKNEETIGADLPDWLDERIERYLEGYRPLICRSHTHKGFWASAKGQPATANVLYNAFKQEVKAALGLELTLHDVRRIGVTTWAVHDPANAAGAKDILGDRSDRVVAQHYNLANGVEASRRMAEILARHR
jgi:integrase